MFKKGNKFYSIFKFKCPHCHEGEFFVSKNPYNIAKAGEIHETCNVCHRKLSLEPGFYYGALYVAYALGVASFVSAFVATYVLFPEATTGVYIAAVLSTIIVGGPWLYALSKIIWINLFVSYKGVNDQNLTYEKDDLKHSESENTNINTVHEHHVS